MIPSVLRSATTSSPNSSSNKQPYLPLPPVASTSSTPATNEPQHHCSQCKRDKPESEFPTKLINLQPYLVCTLHEWYWTEQKRALHWAPDHSMSMSEACEIVRRIAQGEECDDRLMIKGDEDDLKEIVDTLAKAGRYVAKKLTPRASRAKPSATEPPPPPTWLYGFRDSLKTNINRFKLTVYYHRTAEKFTMTLKPDGKQGRSDKPWARPDRKKTIDVVESRDEKKKGKEREQAYERFVPPPPSTAHDGPNRHSMMDAELPQALLDISAKEVSTIHDNSLDSTTSDSLSRAQRDAQQMPPPPIPPRKKARRVEPCLIAPAPPRPSSTAFIRANSLSSELPKPPPRFDNTSTRPPDPSSSYSSASSFTSPLAAPYAYPETIPSSSSSKYVSPHTLTLFEMLAMPDFDPPMIPLLPRQRAARPTPQTQTTPAAAGRELDGLVADALGGTTPREGESDEEEEEMERDRIQVDEGDYEDSIPDDSSEDERDGEGDGEGDEGIDDGASVSSFFESSAEESAFGSGDEEEEEEEEGDWLAGFVSKQMPGMVEDEEEEDEEEQEPIPQPQSSPERPERRSSPRKRGREAKQNGKKVLEDEVDELDSSGEGE